MKKRILILLLCISTLFFTGCGVEYNIEYRDLNFYEDIKLIVRNNEANQGVKKYIEDNDFYVHYDYTNEYTYDKKITEDNDFIYFDFLAKYRKLGYSSSRVFSECFTSYSVIEDDNSIIISTGEGFNCWNYEYNTTDYIDINFKTDNIVIQHNADEVIGNVYKWHITKDNALDFKLLMVVSNKVNLGSAKYTVDDFMSGQVILVLTIASIILIGIILIFVFKKISDKKNEI